MKTEPIEDKPNKSAVILDSDFGFTFVEEKDDIEAVKEGHINEMTEMEARLETLYNAIIPFLDNLCKNPEMKTISWPNRVEKITEYKEKLKSIKEGKL
jgi:hypothetical protein